MGLTYIQASIANPARPRRSAKLKFLVDSGALYSVVPARVLRRLGIKPGKTTENRAPESTRNFNLAPRRGRAGFAMLACMLAHTYAFTFRNRV